MRRKPTNDPWPEYDDMAPLPEYNSASSSTHRVSSEDYLQTDDCPSRQQQHRHQDMRMWLVIGGVGILGLCFIVLAVALQGPHQPATALSAADEAYARGNRSFYRQDYTAAYNAYSEAIWLNPKDKLYYLARGNVQFAQMEHEHATADYNQAIKLAPDYGPAFFTRGTLSWALGDLDSAERDYRKAVELEPDDSLFYDRLADVLYKRDATAEVERLYRAAYEQDPTREWALPGWFDAMFTNGRPDAVLTTVGDLERRGTQSASLYYYAALVHKQRGNLQEAIKSIERGIQLDPDKIMIESYCVAAALYHRVGKPDEYAKRFKEYARRMGRPPHDLRGRCQK